MMKKNNKTKRTLFKFKRATEENVNDLCYDKLWVSNIYSMNDPMDLAFYINEQKTKYPFTNKEIIEFQKYLTSSVYCASFTTVYSNKRLWNYYSDGFSGFAIGYKPSTIKDALKRMNLTYTDNKVVYDGETFDYSELFNSYLSERKNECLLPWKSLFSKDKSWKEEKEYRFSISTPNSKIEGNGFKLCNIQPSVIYVGYKIDKNLLKRIFEYCDDKSIPLRMYIPKFHSTKVDYQAIEIKSLDIYW